MQPLALDGKRILVIVYGHIADTMAATPGLRSLRAVYPRATIEVLALNAAAPVLGGCPYIDRLVTFDDFGHKGSRLARVGKLQWIAQIALRLRRRRYDATLVFHRSSGALRKLATLVGSPVIAGVSSGHDGYTHAAPHPETVESSREENLRVLRAIGVQDDGGAAELWASPADSAWAGSLLDGAARPVVGLHPGSDWSCQQWLPERFAAVARDIRERTGATVVITGSRQERDLQREIAAGLDGAVIPLCGETSFGQFVEVIRRLDVLICVNSAAAAIARATDTPSVVLLGLEDARYTGLATAKRLTVIQAEGQSPSSGWCEFGRWGVLSGCNSPMCRGVGGLAAVSPESVAGAAIRLLDGSRLSASL